VRDSCITGNTVALPISGGGIHFSCTNLTVRSTETSGNSPNSVQKGLDIP
jgi:hypothetical protein